MDIEKPTRRKEEQNVSRKKEAEGKEAKKEKTLKLVDIIILSELLLKYAIKVVK